MDAGELRDRMGMIMQRLRILGWLALGAAATSLAWADETGSYNGFGVFFSATEYTTETSATVLSGIGQAYLVLINSDAEFVNGYECGIEFDEYGDQAVFVLASGTHGWRNLGNNKNHLVTMSAPGKPVEPDGTVVLSTLDLVYLGAEQVDIKLGPATPAGLPEWDGPVVYGWGPHDPRYGFLTGGVSGVGFQVVARINGPEVVATAARSWGQVKQLFR